MNKGKEQVEGTITVRGKPGQLILTKVKCP